MIILIYADSREPPNKKLVSLAGAFLYFSLFMSFAYGYLLLAGLITVTPVDANTVWWAWIEMFILFYILLVPSLLSGWIVAPLMLYKTLERIITIFRRDNKGRDKVDKEVKDNLKSNHPTGSIKGDFILDLLECEEIENESEYEPTKNYPYFKKKDR